MRGRSEPYSELGKAIDELARRRQVRGPYNIAYYIEDATGYKVSGQAVSKHLRGEHLPGREFVKAFAEAFELSPQEQEELAWIYAYGFSKH